MPDEEYLTVAEASRRTGLSRRQTDTTASERNRQQLQNALYALDQFHFVIHVWLSSFPLVRRTFL